MLLEERLARMPRWLGQTIQLAEAIDEVEGVRILPAPPQVNMFHVWMDRSAEEVEQARDRVARTLGLWLFGRASPGPLPGTCKTEIYVADAALAIGPDEVAEGFRVLMSC